MLRLTTPAPQPLGGKLRWFQTVRVASLFFQGEGEVRHVNWQHLLFCSLSWENKTLQRERERQKREKAIASLFCIHQKSTSPASNCVHKSLCVSVCDAHVLSPPRFLPLCSTVDAPFTFVVVLCVAVFYFYFLVCLFLAPSPSFCCRGTCNEERQDENEHPAPSWSVQRDFSKCLCVCVCIYK